jgi:hypothetical protein
MDLLPIEPHPSATLYDLANRFRTSQWPTTPTPRLKDNTPPGIVYHVGHALMGNLKTPVGEVYQAMGNAILKHKMKHNTWLPLQNALHVARQNLSIRAARGEMPLNAVTDQELIEAYQRQLAYAKLAEAQWGNFPTSPKTIQGQPALHPTTTTSWLG